MVDIRLAEAKNNKCLLKFVRKKVFELIQKRKAKGKLKK